MDRNCASTFFDILLFDDGPILEIPQIFDQPLQMNSIEKVSNFKIFFKSCLAFVKYKDVMQELSQIIEKPHPCLHSEKFFNHIHRTMNIVREIHMNSHIGDYDMDFIILDLGSYVTILTRKTWELIGNPQLVWSHVNIILSNEMKFFNIG